MLGKSPPKDGLVHVSLFVRRLVRRVYGPVLVVALGAWVVTGGASVPMGIELAVGTLVGSALLVSRLRARLSSAGRRGAGAVGSRAGSEVLVDVELGALLAVGLDAALLRYEGDLNGSLSPAVYVLVALVAS